MPLNLLSNRTTLLKASETIPQQIYKVKKLISQSICHAAGYIVLLYPKLNLNAPLNVKNHFGSHLISGQIWNYLKSRLQQRPETQGPSHTELGLRISMNMGGRNIC